MEVARKAAVLGVMRLNASRLGAVTQNTVADLDDKGTPAAVRYIWKDNDEAPTPATTWTEELG
jgi:hypothetical protein